MYVFYKVSDKYTDAFLQDGGVARFDELFKKSWDENETPETPAESDEEGVIVSSYLYPKIYHKFFSILHLWVLYLFSLEQQEHNQIMVDVTGLIGIHCGARIKI